MLALVIPSDTSLWLSLTHHSHVNIIALAPTDKYFNVQTTFSALHDKHSSPVLDQALTDTPETELQV